MNTNYYKYLSKYKQGDNHVYMNNDNSLLR